MWYVCVEINYISVNRTFLLTNTVQILSHDILRDALKLQGYMFWWLKCSNKGRLGDDSLCVTVKTFVEMKFH